MALPILEKILGRTDARPAQELEKRLERLLRDIGKPRIANPSKYWFAKEVQKSTAPTLLSIPFEKANEFAVVWAQNRVPYGLMLFAQSQYPTIDYDLWAYTRTQYRGLNIAKLTLAEGIRQLALENRDIVLTAEILIENERTRSGAVRWLKVLGFIASQSEAESEFKRLYMATYTRSVLQEALQALTPEYQKPGKKMPPMPPDILSKFTAPLTESFDRGGSDLLNHRRAGV